MIAVNVAAGLYGRKVNVTIRFDCAPTLRELHHRVTQVFGELCRTLRPPQVPRTMRFRIEYIEVYDFTLGEWVDLVHPSQIVDGGQLFCWQPQCALHLQETQQALPTAVPVEQALQEAQRYAAETGSTPTEAAADGSSSAPPGTSLSAKLRAIFAYFDPKSLGHASAARIRKAMQRCAADGAPTAELQELLLCASRGDGGHGQVPFDEWVAFAARNPGVVDTLWLRIAQRSGGGRTQSADGRRPGHAERRLKGREAAQRSHSLEVRSGQPRWRSAVPVRRTELRARDGTPLTRKGGGAVRRVQSRSPPGSPRGTLRRAAAAPQPARRPWQGNPQVAQGGGAGAAGGPAPQRGAPRGAARPAGPQRARPPRRETAPAEHCCDATATLPPPPGVSPRSWSQVSEASRRAWYAVAAAAQPAAPPPAVLAMPSEASPPRPRTEGSPPPRRPGASPGQHSGTVQHSHPCRARSLSPSQYSLAPPREPQVCPVPARCPLPDSYTDEPQRAISPPQRRGRPGSMVPHAPPTALPRRRTPPAPALEPPPAGAAAPAAPPPRPASPSCQAGAIVPDAGPEVRRAVRERDLPTLRRATYVNGRWQLQEDEDHSQRLQ
eukprot:TRINITY_DN14710_c0_g1_i1.p1 TRINITY_DN14710_c0_g1~~TRINITY_DN14710_c0_g1_i1.p1  ORF type:complete len:607 (+),score=90.56 TRINITY_DN14710_c0_g1_i1:72-1892(+)